MRIYKIINPELKFNASEFLIDLNDRINTKNELYRKYVPFEYNTTYGRDSHWDLLPLYIAFKPTEPLQEIPKGWKASKVEKGFYEPDGRTKIGREFNNRTQDVQGFNLSTPDAILNLKFEYTGRFTPPMIYKAWDDSEYYYKCDDRNKLNKSDFEEVLISYVEEKLNKPS